MLFLCVHALLAASQARFDRDLTIPVVENGNTLRNPWAGGINYPWISPIDLNVDGLYDLFLFDKHNNRITTFLNNGSASASTAWDYAPEYAQQFPAANKWVFLYDYDCDGRSDFFTLSTALQCSGIMVYRNVTTPGMPLQWSLVSSCLQERFLSITQNIFTSSVSLPEFVDYDGDGDMDILGYNTLPDGRILYHKNYSMENYGVCDSLDFKLENLCLGNFQLRIGSTNSVGCFHCPCRVRRPSDSDGAVIHENQSSVSYLPSADQSEAARRDDTISGIMAIDLDGDGNLELLVGDIASDNSLMVHNGGTEMDAQDTLFPSYDSPALFRSFHFHSYIDIDNDQLNDLIVMANDHENKKGIWSYKNTGTNSAPVFNFDSDAFLVGQMIDVGEDACPVLFDYDSDGLLDLVVNKSIFDPATGLTKTGLYLYRNTGTNSAPAFLLVNTDFAGLEASGLYTSPVYPAFGDLDNDGDQDMLIGNKDGHLHYYTNTAGPGNAAVFGGLIGNYMGIDIGNFATPQLFDLDKDGKLDIICGGQRGFVNYFNNRGTLTSPLFNAVPTEDTLGCINLQAIGTTDGYTVPFFYDSLGSTRLLVANENGLIYQYDQIDGNLSGCFHMTGTVAFPSESNRVKFNITVSGGDLNGDSLTDLVIGQSTGGVEIRMQRVATSGISWVADSKISFDIFPNPSNGIIQVRLNYPPKKTSQLIVYNSIGEEIINKNFTGMISELNTDQWISGLYLVHVISGGVSFTSKLVRN